MPSQVLNTFEKNITYIPFDVDNEEHLIAYVMLNYHGRQHPTLRFQLEEPFTNVVHMMQTKIVERVCRKGDTFEKAKQLSDKLKADRLRAKAAAE